MSTPALPALPHGWIWGLDSIEAKDGGYVTTFKPEPLPWLRLFLAGQGPYLLPDGTWVGA